MVDKDNTHGTTGVWHKLPTGMLMFLFLRYFIKKMICGEAIKELPQSSNNLRTVLFLNLVQLHVKTGMHMAVLTTKVT